MTFSFPVDVLHTVPVNQCRWECLKIVDNFGVAAGCYVVQTLNLLDESLLTCRMLFEIQTIFQDLQKIILQRTSKYLKICK